MIHAATPVDAARQQERTAAAPGAQAFPGSYPWDGRATNGGYLAFFIGASFFLSAIPGARPDVGGLSVHPYLILLVAALPIAFAVRNRSVLRRGLGGAGILLLGGLFVSTLFASDLVAALQLYTKWLTVGFTFFIVERLINTARDFKLAAYGMLIGICGIALRGLYLYRLEPTYYLEILPGIGSRNVFSLWTIAPMVFALLLFTSARATRRAKILLLAAVVVMIVPQVLTLSRSGWLLIAAIFMLVFASRFRLRLVVLLFVGLIALNFTIERLGFEEKVEMRIEDLRTGTRSDSLRREMIVEGLALFARNPLFGVSQADLPFEMGRALHHPPTSSHNLFVDLLAGTGILGTFPFLFCLLIIFRRWRRSIQRGHFRHDIDLRRALPVLVLAVGFRALTSDEVLFCPAIVFGIAIAYGLLTSRPRAADGSARAIARPAEPLQGVPSGARHATGAA